MKIDHVVAVDHGNKAIKNSCGFQFNSGFVSSDVEPILKQQLLQYGNTFYSLSSERFPVMIDKTIDSRFFVLSLPAIANTLKAYANNNEKQDIILGVGLPIAYYGTQKNKFREYFIKDNVEFAFNGDLFNINIKDCMVFPQGYAGVITKFKEYVNVQVLNVIDIGGFTTDILKTERGILDIKSCICIPMGVIHLFNQIKQEVLKLGVKIEESQIEAIILGENITFYEESIKNIVEDITKQFVNDLLDRIREFGYEMRMNPSVFHGGGALLLRKYIENNSKVSYTEILNEFANADGYEILTQQAMAKRRIEYVGKTP